MGEGSGQETQPGRRHIIERPRLTRLLDQSTARIIMLVAPAGYGKTTLAEQWLRTKPHSWYRASSASADVAALAAGISHAAATITGSPTTRVPERLRATDDPEADVPAISQLLAEELAAWPGDAWLALDDYHFIMEAPAAEELVDQIAARAPVRLVITSRRRPSWASARRLLYGELYEIGGAALSMTEDEAAAVLHAAPRVTSGLVALAQGWPAVIGMATLAPTVPIPEEDFPTALYDYFAEELYQKASLEIRHALARLALAPLVDAGVAAAVLGENSKHVLMEGLRLGFLTSGDSTTYVLHPLLREFLVRKLFEEQSPRVKEIATQLTRVFIARRCWDDAFSVVERTGEQQAFACLLHEAFDALLQGGRLPTLERWLARADAVGVDSPIVDLASAELASRHGAHSRAEALAVHAAQRLDRDDRLRVQALLLAGRAAHLGNRDDEAVRHYGAAKRSAKSPEDARAALRGQLLSALDLEDPAAIEFLNQLERLSDESPESMIHLSAARLTAGLHSSSINIRAVIEQASHAAHLLAKVQDPVLRCGFLNMFANALGVSGQYRRALEVVRQEREVADQYRLAFVYPYTYVAEAVAESGLGRFARGVRAIAKLEAAAASIDDAYLGEEATILQARIAVMRGDYRTAIKLTETENAEAPVRCLQAERLVWRAFALMLAGDYAAANDAGDRATKISGVVEVQAAAPWIRAAIATTAGDSDASRLCAEALDRTVATHALDSFISAYRVSPELLDHVTDGKRQQRALIRLAREMDDERLASRFGGASMRRHQTRLTAREVEVVGLLAEGLSNREIANRLVLTEVTVKVHVRHILQKLGVRSRTEAAVRAVNDPQLLIG